MSKLKVELVARPLSEWHEDMGAVLWWRFPIEEPPYVGSPLDRGQSVRLRLLDRKGDQLAATDACVEGWPGYHTHWTPIIHPLIRSDMK